jgi:hypothetical protein
MNVTKLHPVPRKARRAVNPGSLRAAVIASWHAAQRAAEAQNQLVLNVASTVGMYLELGGHEVSMAKLLMPSAGTFFARCRAELDRIDAEDGANVIPFRRTT